MDKLQLWEFKWEVGSREWEGEDRKKEVGFVGVWWRRPRGENPELPSEGNASSVSSEGMFEDSWIALGGKCEFIKFGGPVRRLLDCPRRGMRVQYVWKTCSESPGLLQGASSVWKFLVALGVTGWSDDFTGGDRQVNDPNNVNSRLKYRH